MKETLLKIAIFTSLGLQVNAQNPGINIANMDKSVDPRDHFYQYANGTWLKNTKIPAQDAIWSSFNEMINRNFDRLKNILEECEANKNEKNGTNKQKLGDFYRTGMDTISIEKEGFLPLTSDLEKINKINNISDLFKALGYFHGKGVSSVFTFYVNADMKNSNDNAVYFYQPDLSLPDKTYYTDVTNASICLAYKKHMANLFSLLGDKTDVATKNAQTVFDIETQMANASVGSVDLGDSDKEYNKFNKDVFFKAHAKLDFTNYFNEISVSNSIADVIVAQPLYFDKLNQIITSVSIADWKIYLKWCLIHKAAPYLSSAFVKENFSFFRTTLSGVTEIKPRWKRVTSNIDDKIGDALGQVFVEKYFDMATKNKVNEMIDNIAEVFKERIKTLNWMSDTTKQKAVEKLALMKRKVGFPDKWKDYTTLEIKNDSYISNIFRADHFAFLEMIHKIGKPFDKTEWGVTPQTADAFYNPSKNQLIILAGITQSPFFNEKADDAINYGALGGIIGHEFTHGFDDDGSKYDGNGNLIDWWTVKDKKNFEARTTTLRQQFDNYIAIDTLHVNGELTLGENIADLGGLTLSYYAYEHSLKGKKSPVIDGFTGEQRFFISWAQAWKLVARPEAIKQRLIVDPHSPMNYRVDGPLSDMKEFYEAFDVKENNKMYRAADKRAEIW